MHTTQPVSTLTHPKLQTLTCHYILYCSIFCSHGPVFVVVGATNKTQNMMVWGNEYFSCHRHDLLEAHLECSALQHRQVASFHSQNTLTHPKTCQLYPSCSYLGCWHDCWDMEQCESSGPLSQWLPYSWGSCFLWHTFPLPPLAEWHPISYWWFHPMESDTTCVAIMYSYLQFKKRSTKGSFSLVSL